MTITGKTYIFIYTFLLLNDIMGSPLDTGKYIPQKYRHNEGKYYRPPNEGKYIPGDEGRYTYVYKQGLYPTDNGDYRYIHIVGPDGPNGGSGGPDGGYGPNGGYGTGGGYGSNGGFGPDGGYGPDGPNGPGWNDYVGNRIYAENYPYIHDVIEQLVDRFVSKNYLLYGDSSEFSEDFYKKMGSDDISSAAKCEYIYPKSNESAAYEELSPNEKNIEQKEEIRQFYKFNGLKSIVTNEKRKKKRIKLQYEITVRVIDQDNEDEAL